MNVFHAIILGAVQGITEFLPISSDGHLVVVGYFLGDGLSGRDALGFDILLHCGSLIAIVFGFWDVWTRAVRDWRTIGLVVLATVPGVIAGLFLQDVIANDLRSLTAAAIGFLITAACLIAGEAIGGFRAGDKRLPRVLDALLIGIAQAVAILPGVSRSGLTVSTARGLGIQRESALNFSFLMALPIIGGAVAKTFLDAFDGSIAFPAFSVSLAGFVTSAACSFLAVLFLRRFVRSYSFAWFAWYLIPLALVLLAEDAGLRTYLDAPHATEAVRTFGVIAVFLFALIEVIPPFSFVSPGISALIVAGSLAPDVLSLVFFALAAFAASFIGNTVLYYAGRFAGPSFIGALRIGEELREKGERLVLRSGVWAVIGGQFVSALRPVVSFAAGVLAMHPAKFFTAAVVGALLWGASALAAGYFFGNHITLLITIVVLLGALVLAGVGVTAIVEWWRLRKINLHPRGPSVR